MGSGSITLHLMFEGKDMQVEVFRVSKGHLGKGIYTEDNPVSEHLFELSGAHPSPSDDASLKYDWQQFSEQRVQDDYIFGFKSLDQLRQWLYRTEWRQGLHDAGFEVHKWTGSAKLRVPYIGDRMRRKGTMIRPYVQGDTQMVFMPAYFNYIDSVSLLSI